MRQVLEIFWKFTRATGRPHPDLLAAAGNYVGLLTAMGDTKNEIILKKEVLAEMRDGLWNGCESNRNKIREGMMFLEWCQQTANNGMMHAWCEEKLAYIRTGFTDLDRRKNSNHPNYLRNVENIRGWLMSWPVVNSWHEAPPRRPLKPKIED